MKWMHCAQITVLIAGVSCGAVLAQAPASPSAPMDSGGAPLAAPANSDLSSAVLEWVPPALTQLSSQAVAKESFTFDRNMLAVAAGLIPDSDADVRQTVAKLDGVSVHMLRFGDPAAIDPTQVDSIREAYHLRGWKHLVSTSNAGGPLHDGNSDVWLVLDGSNIRGAVVLVESRKSLTLVTVAGNISPVDLLLLRGHFGIPRFDGDWLGNPRRN
jgi:hypothetical protein